MTDQELRLAILDRALTVALNPEVTYPEGVVDFIVNTATRFEKFVVGEPTTVRYEVGGYEDL